MKKLHHLTGILILTIIMASMSFAAKNVSETEAKNVTANSKIKQKNSVVYSFSNVSSTEEGTQISQLTIATGSDGKYHYLKNENGKKQEGIWDGPLPSAPKVDTEKLLSDMTTETKEADPELSSLSTQIHSSIEDYLKNALLDM